MLQQQSQLQPQFHPSQESRGANINPDGSNQQQQQQQRNQAPQRVQQQHLNPTNLTEESAQSLGAQNVYLGQDIFVDSLKKSNVGSSQILNSSEAAPVNPGTIASSLTNEMNNKNGNPNNNHTAYGTSERKGQFQVPLTYFKPLSSLESRKQMSEASRPPIAPETHQQQQNSRIPQRLVYTATSESQGQEIPPSEAYLMTDQIEPDDLQDRSSNPNNYSSINTNYQQYNSAGPSQQNTYINNYESDNMQVPHGFESAQQYHNRFQDQLQFQSSEQQEQQQPQFHPAQTQLQQQNQQAALAKKATTLSRQQEPLNSNQQLSIQAQQNLAQQYRYPQNNNSVKVQHLINSKNRTNSSSIRGSIGASSFISPLDSSLATAEASGIFYPPTRAGAGAGGGGAQASTNHNSQTNLSYDVSTSQYSTQVIPNSQPQVVYRPEEEEQKQEQQHPQQYQKYQYQNNENEYYQSEQQQQQNGGDSDELQSIDNNENNNPEEQVEYYEKVDNNQNNNNTNSLPEQKNEEYQTEMNDYHKDESGQVEEKAKKQKNIRTVSPQVGPKKNQGEDLASKYYQRIKTFNESSREDKEALLGLERSSKQSNSSSFLLDTSLMHHRQQNHRQLTSPANNHNNTSQQNTSQISPIVAAVPPQRTTDSPRQTSDFSQERKAQKSNVNNKPSNTASHPHHSLKLNLDAMMNNSSSGCQSNIMDNNNNNGSNYNTNNPNYQTNTISPAGSQSYISQQSNTLSHSPALAVQKHIQNVPGAISTGPPVIGMASNTIPTQPSSTKHRINNLDVTVTTSLKMPSKKSQQQQQQSHPQEYNNQFEQQQQTHLHPNQQQQLQFIQSQQEQQQQQQAQRQPQQRQLKIASNPTQPSDRYPTQTSPSIAATGHHGKDYHTENRMLTSPEKNSYYSTQNRQAATITDHNHDFYNPPQHYSIQQQQQQLQNSQQILKKGKRKSTSTIYIDMSSSFHGSATQTDNNDESNDYRSGNRDTRHSQELNPISSPFTLNNFIKIGEKHEADSDIAGKFTFNHRQEQLQNQQTVSAADPTPPTSHKSYHFHQNPAIDQRINPQQQQQQSFYSQQQQQYVPQQLQGKQQQNENTSNIDAQQQEYSKLRNSIVEFDQSSSIIAGRMGSSEFQSLYQQQQQQVVPVMQQQSNRSEEDSFSGVFQESEALAAVRQAAAVRPSRVPQLKLSQDFITTSASSELQYYNQQHSMPTETKQQFLPLAILQNEGTSNQLHNNHNSRQNQKHFSLEKSDYNSGSNEQKKFYVYNTNTHSRRSSMANMNGSGVKSISQNLNNNNNSQVMMMMSSTMSKQNHLDPIGVEMSVTKSYNRQLREQEIALENRIEWLKRQPSSTTVQESRRKSESRIKMEVSQLRASNARMASTAKEDANAWLVSREQAIKEQREQQVMQKQHKELTELYRKKSATEAFCQSLLDQQNENKAIQIKIDSLKEEEARLLQKAIQKTQKAQLEISLRKLLK